MNAFSRIGVSPVRTKTFRLTGGLNEQVSNIEIKPGELVRAVNYLELEGSYHGYESTKGYEVFDGQALASTIPHEAYAAWVTGTLYAEYARTSSGGSVYYVKAGEGHTSSAAGAVGNEPGVGDTWTDKWTLEGTTAVANTLEARAREVQRALITEVGEADSCSGSVLGVHIYNDKVYAFRNNTAGTAASMYVESASADWTAIPMTRRIYFDTGTVEWTKGEVVEEQTNGGTATIQSYSTLSGTWAGGDAAGYLLVTGYTGTWAEDQAIHGASTGVAVVNYEMIAFDGGTTAFTIGATISGAGGGTGTIVSVHVTSGAWGDGDAAGYVVMSGASGTFVDDEALEETGGEPGTAVINGTNTWAAPELVLDDSGTYEFINYRFGNWTAYPNEEVMLWVDSNNQCYIYNGYAIDIIDMYPTVGAATFPTKLGAWHNRLFLAYPNGHLLFSELGNPAGWDASTGIAGEIFIGQEITDIIEAPGGVLVIFTNDFIEVLYYGSTDTDFIFKKETYSRNTGALSQTVQNLLGTLYFTDDQGMASLETVQEYGDFSANVLGKKVRKTFATNRDNMSFSVVDRDTNRFFQFYTDSASTNTHAFAYTFNNKKLKGVTKIHTELVMNCITEGDISGVNQIYFGADDGYVYKFQSGTSFNGAVIETDLQTSYNHYGSYRYWKHFKRLAFEMIGDDSTELTVYAKYNYGDEELSRPQSQTVDGSSGIYGFDYFGTAVFGSSEVGDVLLYNYGIGTNMSIRVQSSSKYKSVHAIYNISTDYTMGSIHN